MSHSGLDQVRQGIGVAALAAGRDPASITLIAVSKTFETSDIQPVIAAGQRVFGENRVQEAKAKWPLLRNKTPELRLHLIGPLQSNKAADAVALFDAIHTVDRPKIAQALALEMKRQQRFPQLFIQINTGHEEQKAGIAPQDSDQFIGHCRDQLGLAISGLMCIPPAGENPAPHFELLAQIAKRNGLPGLSMGMSGDYAVAISYGATHVRIGSAIFGSRPTTR
jgi:PLP dependent protein